MLHARPPIEQNFRPRSARAACTPTVVLKLSAAMQLSEPTLLLDQPGGGRRFAAAWCMGERRPQLRQSSRGIRARQVARGHPGVPRIDALARGDVLLDEGRGCFHATMLPPRAISPGEVLDAG